MQEMRVQSLSREDSQVRKIPREGKGSSVQYSCLGSPMNRGAWQAAVHGVTKELDMTDRLSTTPSPWKHGWGLDQDFGDWMEDS